MMTCNECNKSATHCARNMYEIPTDDYIRKYKPGEWQYGCNEHRVFSFTYGLDGEHDAWIDALQIIAESKLYSRIRK